LFLYALKYFNNLIEAELGLQKDRQVFAMPAEISALLVLYSKESFPHQSVPEFPAGSFQHAWRTPSDLLVRMTLRCHYYLS